MKKSEAVVLKELEFILTDIADAAVKEGKAERRLVSSVLMLVATRQMSKEKDTSQKSMLREFKYLCEQYGEMLQKNEEAPFKSNHKPAERIQ